MTGAANPDHGVLMDSIYRGQRHVYDATRKFYLFGRDRLIERLDCRPGMTVLEIGCGTGRNLDRIARRWPGVALFGLDISSEMLKSAEATLKGRARLSLGDAVAFDAAALFGRAAFDRVVISFALSMIPEWEAALAHSVDCLAPGGSLHIVDFGDLRGLPWPLRPVLEAWLRHFHVTPRRDLAERSCAMADGRGIMCRAHRGPLGYYRRLTISNLRRYTKVR